MKKFIIMVAVMMFFWASGAIQAQEWSWEDPVQVSPPMLIEIAAGQSGGTLYGITADTGNVVTIDHLTGVQSDLAAGDDGANDIAIGPYGLVYICTDDKIKYYDSGSGSFMDILGQPVLPTDAMGDPLPGTFIRITMGQGGMLYVLFETSENETVQYLLTGTPPVITEGVLIDINPNTLNLKSRGKWVTCYINLPEGYDENDIDPDSVQITNISIPSQLIDQDVVINRGLRSPWNVEEVEGEQVLMVKFPRHHKNIPEPQWDTLRGKLLWLLTNKPAGFYWTKFTVEGSLITGETFIGSDGIRVRKWNRNW